MLLLLAFAGVALAASEKKCLLDLFSSQAGGDVCVLDVDELCKRPHVGIVKYETMTMAFDGSQGGYDYMLDRVQQSLGAALNVTSLTRDAVTFYCEYSGHTLEVFDQDSLDACFAIAEVDGKPLLELTLTKYEGPDSNTCMRFPDEGASSALPAEIYTAVQSEVDDLTVMSFDANNDGKINDGGVDAWDYGFHITTSDCSLTDLDQRIKPWATGFNKISTDCISGGYYQMAQTSGIMTVLFERGDDAEESLNVWFTGHKGSGPETNPALQSYENDKAVGWSQCYIEAGQPSSFQKMVIARKGAGLDVESGTNGRCYNSDKHPRPSGGFDSSDCANLFVNSLPPGEAFIIVLWMEDLADKCGKNDHTELFEKIAALLDCED